MAEDRYFTYVCHSARSDYEEIGWRPSFVPGPHHSHYSLVYEWCGEGAPKLPEKRIAADVEILDSKHVQTEHRTQTSTTEKSMTDNIYSHFLDKNIFIRTVTMALTGRLVVVGPQELLLEDAAWIADTGRYANAIASGDFSEVEPYPADRKVIVGRGAIIDAVEINTLPRTQK